MTTAVLDRATEVAPPIPFEATAQEEGAAVATKELVIVSWSGELDRVGSLGITRSLIPGMGEPAGAATAISIMTEANASLFI